MLPVLWVCYTPPSILVGFQLIPCEITRICGIWSTFFWYRLPFYTSQPILVKFQSARKQKLSDNKGRERKGCGEAIVNGRRPECHPWAWSSFQSGNEMSWVWKVQSELIINLTNTIKSYLMGCSKRTRWELSCQIRYLYISKWDDGENKWNKA